MTRAPVANRFVVLLRGVNVGGVTVRSADLRTCLEAAGLRDVRTVLASGNALVTADDGVTADTVRERAEAALRARYDRDVRALVRGQAELEATARACPYPADSETHHAYVVFFADDDAASAAIDAAREALDATARGTGSARDGAPDPPSDEAVAPGDRIMYWWCPRGSTLSTPLAKSSTRASRTVLTTTRNLRTVLRLTTG